MVVKINGKEHEVRFGLKFVAELDKAYDKSGNAGYGVGLSYAVPLLLSGDMRTLSEVLHLSFCTEKAAPSKDDVDYYIETVEDIEGLLEEVLTELKNANATKIMTRKMEQLYAQVQKGQETTLETQVDK